MDMKEGFLCWAHVPRAVILHVYVTEGMSVIILDASREE